MGHLDLTVSYDSLRQQWQNDLEFGVYYRFVRVRADTTMQKVFDAITFVEGWNIPAYNMFVGVKKIYPDADVLGLLEIDVEFPLQVDIKWPPVSIRVGRMLEDLDSYIDDSEDRSDSDEHVSGDSQDKSGDNSLDVSP